MRFFKKNKTFKAIALSTLIVTGIACIQVSATGPIPVSGRILEVSRELGDDSSWMEVARFNEFSLIVRLNCLPKRISYNNNGVYSGYLRSNVKHLFDRWFHDLGGGLLKNFIVGNTAESNLGCFDSLDHTVYSFDSPGESKGDGISLPQSDKTPSAFILSFQEARRFMFSQIDLRRTEPAAFANYRILAESRKQEKFYLWGFVSAGTQMLPIEPSWLRSPGNSIANAAFSGAMGMGGRTLFSDSVKQLYYVRPAMWVRSSIFDRIPPHPCSAYTQILDSTISDEGVRTKIKSLLLCEQRNKSFIQSTSAPYIKPKYYISFARNPGMEIIRNLTDAYCRAEIISKNQIVELGQSDISKLSLDDFERFARSKVESAEGGTLYIDAKQIFDVTSKDINLKFKKFLDILAAGKCLVIMTNYPVGLKEYIDRDEWFCSMFETLDFQSHEEMVQVAPVVRPPISECLGPLETLVGMDNFKSLVRSLLHDFRVYEMDSKMGIVRDKPGIHMVLMGGPGTGKTTIAGMLGDILYKAGIIQKNIVVKAERADLVGKYQGHTEAFVRDKLKEAEGGILFIDEAYSLTAGGSRDFGQRAIEGLLTPLTTNQCVIIAAGYTNEMRTFLKSNSGLPGRFDHEIILKDYTSEELFQIFKNLCVKSSLILEDEAQRCVLEVFENAPKGPTFSNARYARKFYETVMRIRSMSLSIDVDIDSLSESEMKDRKTIKPEYIAAAKEEMAKIV